MKPPTDKQLATPLAELETYGLSVRTCSVLETFYKAIYVGDVIDANPETLANIPYFGPRRIEEIQEALKNFLADRQVKTVDECIWDNEQDC